MNRKELLDHIEETKKSMAELRTSLEDMQKELKEPEYKPEDLIGKLCYVWNYDTQKSIRVVTEYCPQFNNKFCTGLITGLWEYAEPVPEAEVLEMIYKPEKTEFIDLLHKTKDGELMFDAEKCLSSEFSKSFREAEASLYKAVADHLMGGKTDDV